MALTDVFYTLGPDNIAYLLIFLTFFAIIMTSLKRLPLFKDPYGNPNLPSMAIIAFSVSALIVYGISRSDFSFENFFYDVGFSAESLLPVLTIIIIIVALFIIWKFKFGALLIALGLSLILATLFTSVIYEKTTALVIGIIIIFIGFLLLRRVRKWVGKHYDPKKEKRQWKSGNLPLLIGILIIALGFVLKIYWGLSQTGTIIIFCIGALFAMIGIIGKIVSS